MNTITWDDFEKVDMRIGTIIAVEDFPEARKTAYKLKIDFGELGIKKSSAQVTDLYDKNDLINKKIVAVVNFPPKQIGPLISECLVLGAYTEKGVSVLTCDETAKNGDKIG